MYYQIHKEDKNMETNPLERLYGVFVKPQSYLNILYLFLAFPLGIAYFVFLVTGFSLGISLLIVWVGLLVLAGVFALCWPLTLFERQMAISLLHLDIPPLRSDTQPGSTLFQQIKAHLGSASTWKGILFLFLKFPIGIADFTVAVTLLSLSVGLLFAPLAYPWIQIDLGVTRLHSLPAAMVAFFFGLIVAPLSLHVLNFIADLQGKFARYMLSGSQPAYTPPQDPISAPQAPTSPAI
jgi:hypothetical protein